MCGNDELIPSVHQHCTTHREDHIMCRRCQTFVGIVCLSIVVVVGRGWFSTGSGAGSLLASRTVRAAELKAGSEWGGLKGRFVLLGTPPAPRKLSTGGKDGAVCDQHPIVDDSLLVDTESRGIANIAVYVRKTSRIHEKYTATEKAEVVFDQKNCVFLTHVLPIRVSQTLVIKNSDPIGHNSSISPPGDGGINPLLAGGGEQKHLFKRQQTVPVAVTCNIHPWMKAYVFPRNDPYCVATAANGGFELSDLPAGEEIEFQIWHERGKGNQGAVDAKGWAKGRRKLSLKPGEVLDLGEIEVAASSLK